MTSARESRCGSRAHVANHYMAAEGTRLDEYIEAVESKEAPVRWSICRGGPGSRAFYIYIRLQLLWLRFMF